MRARIVSYEALGLVVKKSLGHRFTIAYGEILTVERLPSVWGLRLHTRTTGGVRIPCRGETRLTIETELRRRGVRVVDEYGAIIAPTLAEFEEELARAPDSVGQSSDDA